MYVYIYILCVCVCVRACVRVVCVYIYIYIYILSMIYTTSCLEFRLLLQLINFVAVNEWLSFSHSLCRRALKIMRYRSVCHFQQKESS
jgi:hypothetical protein